MDKFNYKKYISLLSEHFKSINKIPKAMVMTYGCQQNTSDSEIIKGLLTEIGYEFCECYEDADLVVFNTCAVREHAELKVYGNIGSLKPVKKKNPDLKIAVCGCMMQQESVQNEIKKSYRHVDIVFGPSLIFKLPQMLYFSIMDGKKIFDRTEVPDIIENMPVKREENGKAWVTVMYGCNNFCTYCIVPYLRGRERSRKIEDIVAEVKQLVNSGFKDITLLGQNVNSYGKDLNLGYDFADLLYKLNEINGDFWLRFMTSHPKDCTTKLLDAMSKCDKVCKQLHLPFQAGNDRVLNEMNRRYNSLQYKELINYAKEKMPDITLTSDVIVGFPGESFDEFMDTVKLVEEIEFDNLYTFIYSKRSGTPAANMTNQIDKQEKSKRFDILLSALHPISKKKNDLLLNKELRVFVEGESKTNKNVLSGKTEGGKTVDFIGDKSLIGQFANVKIIECKTWSLVGKLI